MTAEAIEIENKQIAKQYKELLRISYQSLSTEDKKLIRSAFDTAVDAHKEQRRKSGEFLLLRHFYTTLLRIRLIP